VEVRWRSLFRSTFLGKRCTSYNAPPTSRKRVADRWSLWNFLPQSSLFIVGKAQKSHGARSKLNSVLGLEKVDRWNSIRTFAIQSRSRPMRFLGFSNHEKGAPRQEISKWSTVCSTFSRSGWSVVRNASLAKEGTSKKRPSSHLHKVPTRSNKVSPRTFQSPSYERRVQTERQAAKNLRHMVYEETVKSPDLRDKFLWSSRVTLISFGLEDCQIVYKLQYFKSRSSGLWRHVLLDLWNFGILPHHYTASQPNRPRLESSSPWKPQISLQYYL
jgi:hypothetical protein